MTTYATSNDCRPPVKMRKRKRDTDYGSYVEEDTGEVTTVQTSKQAKRAHQKSGKWYKEPTEAELRAWDREEKKQAAADRAAKKEENKKANAAKRVEKERKEEELKRQMFEAGKISFTQTLAKKDEDQQNLHAWFGGKPKVPKPTAAPTHHAGEIERRDKSIQSENKDKGFDATGEVTKQLAIEDGQKRLEKAQSLSQEDNLDFNDDDLDSKDFFACENIPAPNHNQPSEADRTDETNMMDLISDLVDEPDFEVLEDDSAGTVLPDQLSDQITFNAFKVPAIPTHAQPLRLPLSPMSPSDVNVRNSQTSVKVSSFKARLETARDEEAGGTQSLQSMLLDICTQDLNDALDDLDDLNKENDEPEVEPQPLTAISPVKTAKHSSPPQSGPCARPPTTNPNHSFTSNTASVDYDSIFLELEVAETTPVDDSDFDDFDDCGLDDATLLSLPPATQMVSSALKARPSTASTITSTTSNKIPTKAPRQPFTKNDSFALDGLEDDDLLANFNEYERSQNRIPSVSASVSILGSVSKKKRVLPWDKPSWTADVSSHGRSFGEAIGVGDDEEMTDVDGETVRGTQDTERISNF